MTIDETKDKEEEATQTTIETKEGAKGTIDYYHLFELARKDRDNEEDYQRIATALNSKMREAQTKIQPIEEEWNQYANSNGYQAANVWLQSSVERSSVVDANLAILKECKDQLEHVKMNFASKKLNIDAQLSRERPSLDLILDKIKTIKVYYVDPVRHTTKCNSFRRLGSYKALKASMTQIFPNFAFQICWNENVIGSEDEYSISLGKFNKERQVAYFAEFDHG